MSFVKKLQRIAGNSSPLKRMDEMLCEQECKDLLPPIFLVGAPRVGSTLIYQAIVEKYETTYLTNIHSFFFSEVCLAEYLVRLLKRLGVRYKPTFKSNYGFVSGVLAPSEAGPTQRTWFGESDFELGTHITDCLKIHRALSTLCLNKKGPFVSKNLFNSMRLKQIDKCFPNALIVWIRRDKNDVVRSILKMRQEIYGDKSKWASVKVPGWENMSKMSPEDQVRKQVDVIENYIEKCFGERRSELGVQVQFLQFCESPEKVLCKVMSCYSSITGKSVSVKKSFSNELFQQIRR